MDLFRRHARVNIAKDLEERERVLGESKSSRIVITTYA
jgi:hypothetical protein